MADRSLDCVTSDADGARPLHAVRPDGLARFFDSIPSWQAEFLRETGFKAGVQELAYLPGEAGLAGAVLGLGDDRSPYAFGGLALRLPEGTVWQLAAGDFDRDDAMLGFCLGAYRFTELKSASRGPAKLACATQDSRWALAQAAAIWMVRDLINTPANLLGPAELAEASVALGRRYGAAASVIAGAALEAGYPTVAAVGRGSARPAQVAVFRWS
ncbi:MAG TPA: leucyl aminopeptidase family protein, partial [Acetobacteraceae bacterium]|nr:leucyl aminopeptidase family protein [Acetobacteraceae bacterium]